MQPRPILIRLQVISALICRTVSTASVAPHAVLRRPWQARSGRLAGVTGLILNARVSPRRVPLWGPEARA